MSSAFNIPAGFALVPLEPTQEMKRAANSAYQRNVMATAADLYRAMLSAAPTPPVDAVPGEPVAQCKAGGKCRWRGHASASLVTEHAAASVASRAPCQHRIADARNALVQSGYVCLDCGALFQAADHGVASRAGSEPTWWQSMMLAAAAKSGDAGAIRLAAQLAGCLPCPGCDFVKSACRCLAPIAPAAAAEPSELADMEARKDAAYLERNQVVAALAKCFPSGVARTAIEGWSEDWHGCVFIDLPTGQASWHFHDSQAYLFEGLPPYKGAWDGHDTPEKYRRLAALPDRERAASLVASEDTKRLDWLEKGAENAKSLGYQWDAFTFNFAKYSTIREALDAAINNPKEPNV